MDVRHIAQPAYGQAGMVLNDNLRRFASPASRFTVAVAWAKLSGVSRIWASLNAFKAAGGTAEFVVGIDLGGTSYEALKYLLESGSRVSIYQDASPVRRSFHSKWYLWEMSDEASMLVGSGNLTSGGLFTNYESFDLISLDLRSKSDADYLRSVQEGLDFLTREPATCRQLDEPLLEDLVSSGAVVPEVRTPSTGEDRSSAGAEKLFGSRPGLPLAPAPEILRPTSTIVTPAVPPVAIDIVLSTLRTFEDAVSSGQVNPAAWSSFWVDAGSMSSGGSHNQLELPRMASRFLGFEYSDYSDEHSVLGHPVLVAEANRWEDRPLTWHGNNRMERINLPTRTQGGFDYPRTVVMFRRVDSGFKLEVVADNDAVAIKWRDQSRASGTLYRLGNNTNRLCGLL